MKKECQRTRQALPNYLRGHLYLMSKSRIDRHLQQCVVCRSEFEALKHTEETRQILNAINAPEGVVGRVRDVVLTLRKLKKIVYRPLWMAGLVLIAAGIYYYAATPKQLDIEIERIVKTSSSQTVSPATSSVQPLTRSGTASKQTANIPKRPESVAAAAPAPVIEPLIVTITLDNNTSSVRHINEVMQAHSQLRGMMFTDTVKEISGRLTSKELLTLFSRIKTQAKISYSRKRFNAFPAAQPIPFVLQLRAAPKPAEKPAPPEVKPAPPAAKPAPQPAEQAAPPVTETAPEPAPQPVPQPSAVQ